MSFLLCSLSALRALVISEGALLHQQYGLKRSTRLTEVVRLGHVCATVLKSRLQRPAAYSLPYVTALSHPPGATCTPQQAPEMVLCSLQSLLTCCLGLWGSASRCWRLRALHGTLACWTSISRGSPAGQTPAAAARVRACSAEAMPCWPAAVLLCLTLPGDLSGHLPVVKVLVGIAAVQGTGVHPLGLPCVQQQLQLHDVQLLRPAKYSVRVTLGLE